MKFLFTITLLALIGCAGNKRVINPETYPTCEEFYENNKRMSEQVGYSFEELIEILEVSKMDENTVCLGFITCDGKDYCMEWGHKKYPECDVIYEIMKVRAERRNVSVEDFMGFLEIPMDSSGRDKRKVCIFNGKKYGFGGALN